MAGDRRAYLRRSVRLWLASFLAVVMVSFWIFRAPLLPLLIAGGVTFLVTVLWWRWSKI